MMHLLLCLSSMMFMNVDVSTSAQLRTAISQANPGTTIRLAPGRYQGGLYLSNLHGSPGSPIVIRGADPSRPPVFEGGAYAFMLSRGSYVEFHDLEVQGATSNGINIDDGGDADQPTHHIVLSGVRVRGIGGNGNQDGIKLSGVTDFRIENTHIERWGTGSGSAVDMVGCRNGLIEGSTFRHTGVAGTHNGVQTKGGTANVTIRGCLFEHAGHRSLNIGGSTGLQYFRPRPEGFEAKDILVENCTIIGSLSPVAFVGVDGAVVRWNTIIDPKNWVVRILRETNDPGFVPTRRGVFRENLIYYRVGGLNQVVNVGPNTAPETFNFAGNVWYAYDAPARSRPSLPVAERKGIYGVEPKFRDAANGDYRLDPDFQDPRGPQR